ncbi:MAG: lysophospholipid acyltransferase family protein [Anaerolineae bacterium]
MTQYAVQYPRKVVARTLLRWTARALFTLFAQVKITGLENLPKKGPVILAGNHVAMIETVLMLAYPPYQVEMIAVGDIPWDKRFAPLINAYGVIPVNRGNMDRDGMEMMLDVLKQGGVLGMFPEGGIWETGNKGARTGVAWLSNKGNAPVVPIGFGGITGALGGMIAFKRPKMTMNIGAPIPPIGVNASGKSRKEALAEGANLVMERIEALIPPEDRQQYQGIEAERFDFQAQVQDAHGKSVPAEFSISHKEALSKFFYRPVLLDVLARNLERPVQPLQRLDTDPKQLATAAEEVLTYLTHENPQFLNYRFGYETGAAMLAGMTELRDLARWAGQQGYSLMLKPIRYYRNIGETEEIFEDKPGAKHSG